MIFKLTGKVDLNDPDYVLLDVAGVGYGVYTSLKTRAVLEEGSTSTLFIETQVKEESITLFGFASPDEKAWYKLLTSVQGVGAKVGLAVLSALRLEEIDQALAIQDTTALCQADGVGPKLARRLVTELKDKTVKLTSNSMAFLQSTPTQQTQSISNAYQEALSVLMNLGYDKGQAALALKGAQETIQKEASLEELIKVSLKNLSRL